MRKQLSSFILMVCGIIALVVGFTTLPSPAIVSAQPPQPSPRPPILPTANLSQDEPGPTAVVPGRLTGTVIDLRTGAPMPGIAVVVGRQTLYTDANGNYDVWLESGYYRLDLGLTSNQGTPIQPAQAIAVGPGDTVVVHLFLTSPAPTALPTMTPAAATIVAPLKHLPDTSVAHEPAASGGSSQVSSGNGNSPNHLPRTAAAANFGSPGTWILLGALLLGLSLVIRLAPRRRQRPRLARNRRARAATPAEQPDDSDESLLADLLKRDL
jgi:hypothetical protein